MEVVPPVTTQYLKHKHHRNIIVTSSPLRMVEAHVETSEQYQVHPIGEMTERRHGKINISRDGRPDISTDYVPVIPSHNQLEYGDVWEEGLEHLQMPEMRVVV